MSSSGGSAKVIVIAFLANLGIAVAKFAGALISGSASILAEAIHSLVDCSNQVLLLIGNKKSQKAPDRMAEREEALQVAEITQANFETLPNPTTPFRSFDFDPIAKP